jgi:hypothetical protein
MEDIQIAYPILDQSEQLSITNIIYEDYDFVIKYQIDNSIKITVCRSFIFYKQLITKSNIPLDRLYKLIINSLNKEPNYQIVIRLDLDLDIILDIKFNTKIVDINEQITLIRQSNLLVNNVKELDKNVFTYYVDKVKNLNNKHYICYLISLLLLIIIIIQLILSVNKVKELENKLTICNNNNISELENKLSICENKLSIHNNKISIHNDKLYICNNKLSICDNKLSICENKLYIHNDKLSICDNKLSICENKLSIRNDKLSMCENRLSIWNNNLIDSILQLENKLYHTNILFICMIIYYIIRSLTRTQKTPEILLLNDNRYKRE